MKPRLLPLLIVLAPFLQNCDRVRHQGDSDNAGLTSATQSVSTIELDYSGGWMGVPAICGYFNGHWALSAIYNHNDGTLEVARKNWIQCETGPQIVCKNTVHVSAAEMEQLLSQISVVRNDWFPAPDAGSTTLTIKYQSGLTVSRPAQSAGTAHGVDMFIGYEPLEEKLSLAGACPHVAQ